MAGAPPGKDPRASAPDCRSASPFVDSQRQRLPVSRVARRSLQRPQSRATVFEECGSMYRADGPEELRSLGETEFVTGVAAMSASGGFGPARRMRAMVGNVNLALGSRASSRYSNPISPPAAGAFMRSGFQPRGMRTNACTRPCRAPDARGSASSARASNPGRVSDSLSTPGFIIPSWARSPRWPRPFPETPIVLNHFGSPILGGPNAGRAPEVFGRMALRHVKRSPLTTMSM